MDNHKVKPYLESGVIHATGSKTFYVLTDSEYQDYITTAEEYSKPIKQLADAVQDQSKERQNKVDQAKKQINQKLKPLVAMGEKTDLKELINISGKGWTYVPKSKIKAGGWLEYKLPENKEQISTNGKLDLKKLKKQIINHTKVKAELFEADFSGSMTSWADSFNRKPETALYGNPKDPNDKLDITAKAQILRYTGGASASGGYSPGTGTYSFSAEAHGSLALFEGKMAAHGYIPSKKGYDMRCNIGGKEQDFGSIRVNLEAGLSAFAGASVLVSANIDFQMSDAGKLQLKGTNQRKTKGGSIAVGGNAFAGVEAGCEAGVSVWWKSPEPSGAMEWEEFAELKAEGDGAAGAGIDGEFKIGFDAKTGKFYVHAKATLVCGIGASGSITFVVYAKQIYSFVAYVYHKLKNVHFNYKDFAVIEKDAIKALTNLMTKFIFYEAKKVESDAKQLANVLNEGFKEISSWWDGILKLLEPSKKLEVAMKLADSINTNHTRLTLTRPEVKGRLLFMLTDLSLVAKLFEEGLKKYSPLLSDLGAIVGMILGGSAYETVIYIIHAIEDAILQVLSYIQTKNDYTQVMQHMSLDPTVTVDHGESEKLLYNGAGVYGRSLLRKLKKYKTDKGKLYFYQTDTKSIKDTPVEQNQHIKKNIIRS